MAKVFYYFFISSSKGLRKRHWTYFNKISIPSINVKVWRSRGSPLNMYSFVLPGDNILRWHILQRAFCSLMRWVSVLCSRWGYTTAQWQQGNLRNRKHLSTLVMVVLGAHTRNISQRASPLLHAAGWGGGGGGDPFSPSLCPPGGSPSRSFGINQ